MSDKAIVMYDSPEAATFKTDISGWVTSDGRFYGASEHMARYAGCTHQACDTCGSVNVVGHGCRACRKVKMDAQYAALPVEKWDGDTPLCLYDGNQFFFGDDVFDFLANTPDEVRICKCKPGYLGLVDADNWADDLPEDGELPNEVQAALDVLNAAIKAAGPVCWWEDAIAIDVADLRARISAAPVA